MKTMTLDDLIKQPLSEEDKKIINEAQPVVTEECPEMSDEQLQQFRPWYEVHKNENDIYKVPVKKTGRFIWIHRFRKIMTKAVFRFWKDLNR